MLVYQRVNLHVSRDFPWFSYDFPIKTSVAPEVLNICFRQASAGPFACRDRRGKGHHIREGLNLQPLIGLVVKGY